MSLLAALLLFAAVPFWEAKTPAEWTDAELRQLLNNSPWAQMMPGPTRSLPPVQAYLATAAPIRQAEQELKRRAAIRSAAGNKQAPFDPYAEEYRLWVEDFSPTQIIVAVRVDKLLPYSEAEEIRQLEKESFMRIGRRKIQMTGHFPPSAADPYLRIAFPREVKLSDEQLRFELYIPGIPGGFRSAEFRLGDMQVAGRLEL